MKEFLMKKFGGLPVWAWGLVGIAGVGAGYLLIRWQKSKSSTPSSLTTSNTPDLTTGNASGQETTSATGTVGSNGVIDNPYPETTVNGQQVPIIPPGYQGVYDSNGNLVGWEPIPTNPTPTPPTNPTPPPTTPPPTTSKPPVTPPPFVQPLTKVTMTGALSTIYGGIHNGGRDLLTLQPGQQVDVTGSKVSWGNDTYYPVTYNGTSGWVRAATIGGGPSTGSGTFQPLMTTLSPARRA